MRKIMIVEDEILVRVGLKSFLNWEEYGYIICDEAADGREALEKIMSAKGTEEIVGIIKEKNVR